MKPRAKDNTLTIPPALFAEIQAAAEEEKRSAVEVVSDAIERYIRSRRWERLLAYGRERARALGLTEEDVPRLIAEYRREQRQGR
jgi:metal-responsive CopG/Arc/MetJ family transcriptional regulator